MHEKYLANPQNMIFIKYIDYKQIYCEFWFQNVALKKI